MKRIYSFIALAVMFFGATFNANAEEKTVTFADNGAGSPTEITTEDGVKFTLSDKFTYSTSYDVYWWGLLFNKSGYWIAESTTAKLNWTSPNRMVVKSISLRGRCWGNGHSCDIESEGMERTKCFQNNIFDFGSNDTFEANTLTMEGDNEGSITFYNGGGLCQIKEITITYEISGEAKLENENEATFYGAWTESEINNVVANGVYSNGKLAADKLGAINVTNVTKIESVEIAVVNPNTIIVANEGQVANNSNVVIGRECAYLVITDPLTAAGAQDAGNYSEVDCGYYCGREFTATQASYTRPMSSKYATVMIPFGFDPAAQDATIMDVTNISEAGVEVDPTEYEEIAFGRPFVAKVADGDLVITAENTKVAGSYGAVTSMYGVYTEITLGEGDYYIAQDAFWNASSCEEDVILKPFRCFFDLPEVNAVKLAIKENATAIKNAQIANEEVPAYNLQGIRVAANAKGFVLMNGKKYFNK